MKSEALAKQLEAEREKKVKDDFGIQFDVSAPMDEQLRFF